MNETNVEQDQEENAIEIDRTPTPIGVVQRPVPKIGAETQAKYRYKNLYSQAVLKKGYGHRYKKMTVLKKKTPDENLHMSFHRVFVNIFDASRESRVGRKDIDTVSIRVPHDKVPEQDTGLGHRNFARRYCLKVREQCNQAGSI